MWWNECDDMPRACIDGPLRADAHSPSCRGGKVRINWRNWIHDHKPRSQRQGAFSRVAISLAIAAGLLWPLTIASGGDGTGPEPKRGSRRTRSRTARRSRWHSPPTVRACWLPTRLPARSRSLTRARSACSTSSRPATGPRAWPFHRTAAARSSLTGTDTISLCSRSRTTILRWSLASR